MKGRTSRTAPSSSTTTLPWAIIRLSQRAGPRRPHRAAGGRDTLLFLPAGGWRRSEIIHLRSQGAATAWKRTKKSLVRTSNSLKTTNRSGSNCRIYTPRNPASSIWKPIAKSICPPKRMRIWNNATKDNPWLKKKIEDSERWGLFLAALSPARLDRPQGVITYVKSSDDADALGLDGQRRENRHPVAGLAILRRGANANPIHQRKRDIRLHHDLVHASVQRDAGKRIFSPRPAVNWEGRKARAAETYERLKALCPRC